MRKGRPPEGVEFRSTVTSTRVDVVVPVYNEGRILARSILILVEFLTRHCADDWRIIIADNASTDQTPDVMRDLAARESRVRTLRIEAKGRGRALKAAWRASDVAIHAYMDADLSTELAALPRLLGCVHDGYDVAVGSRHFPEAVLRRGLARDVLSRSYNLLLRSTFRTPLTDAQCGFKANSHRAAAHLLPLIENDGWFFDTELLLLAEGSGYRIAEVPVRWTEDRDSSVRIVPTMLEYLREVWRLGCDGHLALSTRRAVGE
jgi:glycosyltransferase involved in cell wall biosynthesis